MPAPQRLVELGTKAKVANRGFGERIVSIASLNDESILRLYDNIRIQVDADHGFRHKFMTGESVKQHASALRDEITRRRLQHTPIEWQRDL
jgi:hypothetical protein